MAMGNALDSNDDGGSRPTSLSISKGRYYLKDNDYDGLHRSGSTRSANNGSGTSSHRNKTRQNGNAGSNCNWQGRPRAEDPDPSFIAGQIMLLPSMPELDRQAWGSNGKFLDQEGYGHPVLILTNLDNEGYVIFQKMTSFTERTLAERFRSERERTNKVLGSYMQIGDDKPADPDATIVLDLYNEHNTRPKYLRKRSFVETVKSYRCRLDILRSYDYSGTPWFIDATSLDIAIERVLFMKVEYTLPPRRLLNTEKAQHKVAHFNTNSHPDEFVPMPPRKPRFWKKPKQPESLHQSSQLLGSEDLSKVWNAITRSLQPLHNEKLKELNALRDRDKSWLARLSSLTDRLIQRTHEQNMIKRGMELLNGRARKEAEEVDVQEER